MSPRAPGRTADHGGVFRRELRDILEPAGLIPVRGPRYWVDDHGWWLACLSFEPSDFQPGTYLRAGRTYLWVDRGHLAFDEDIVDHWPVRGRSTSFVAAMDGPDWERDIRDLAAASVAWIDSLRGGRNDLRATAERLRGQGGGAWTDFHLGIALGLDGDTEAARTALQRVADVTNQHDAAWLQALRDRAAHLHALVADEPAFRREIVATIARARRRLRLPERSPEIIEPR